jgi:hypothetical protein
MGDFNTMFPNFLNRCLELKNLLIPLTYLLITGGVIAATIAKHRSGSSHLQTFGKAIVLIMVLVYLPTWGNQIVTLVDSTVKDVLKVDPSRIHEQYKAALEMQKAASAERSWWDKLMDWRSAPMEWLLSGIFVFLGWLASAIMWWAYIIQTAILFLGYALSPLFIGSLAFPGLSMLGRRYFLQLVGVMFWPLGWGVAGLITEGVINFMTDRSFLNIPGVGNDLYSLQNLMGLAFLGIWIIFSTIAAPIILQRTVETGSSAAADMISGAFNAGRAAVMAGATTAVEAATGATGVAGAVAVGAVSAVTAAETLVSASTGSGGRSLVGSLVDLHARDLRLGSHARPVSFPSNDPTGDKSVREMLLKSKNPHSQG